LSHHGTKAGITSGDGAQRGATGTQSGHSRPNATLARRPGPQQGGGRDAHLRSTRPGGEGVGVEKVDAVAARCSGAGEDDVRDDQVRLLPHRRLSFMRTATFAFCSPTPLPHSSTPQTSAVMEIGRNPRAAGVRPSPRR
jgi:hypothetical protein